MNYQNASSMAQIETKLVDARQRSKTLLFHQQTAADLAWGTDKYLDQTNIIQTYLSNACKAHQAWPLLKLDWQLVN